MISLYFGLPGCGKTSYLVCRAILTQRSIDCGKSPYKFVYTNVDISYPGIRTIKNISNVLGRFEITDSLILIDESFIEFNNRNYKNFSCQLVQYFCEHRHDRCDVELYSQSWDGVDLTIRRLTDHCYYIVKNKLFSQVSLIIPVEYGLDIPNKDETGKKTYGDILQGYRVCGKFRRLFCTKFYRPVVYRYFDSFSRRERPALPDSLYSVFKDS